MKTTEPSPSLLKQITHTETLRAAWLRVKRNGGGPGGDGQTIAGFAHDLDTHLALLTSELMEGRYKPGPLRRYRIPKTNGKLRKLRCPLRARPRRAGGYSTCVR